jgi:hypothetical protein
MRKMIKKLFNLNDFSFLLLLSPYLIYNFNYLYTSYFFSYFNFFVLLFFILIMDFVLRFNFFNKKFQFIFSSGIFIFIFFFFYGMHSSFFVQDYLESFTGFLFRGRFIILTLFFSLSFLFLIFRNLFIFKYINIFLVVFSVVNFLFIFKPDSILDAKNHFSNNNFKKIDSLKKTNKPLILFIVDEYHSPEDIFQVTGDSSVLDFSKKLIQQNWIVRDNFYSYETSTIHSLSSLFNYNISKNKGFSSLSVSDLGAKYLLKSSLYDSLISKNIQFINFGIFNIGETIPINELYFFPKNFFQVFLFNTIYTKLISTDYHNKFIINNSLSRLNKISNLNSFVYIHLYMPHSPFVFEGEFKSSVGQGFPGYFEYLKFTNKKLDALLLELTKNNKFKIILSGDHGFRGDSRFNSNKTFAAFYGFSEKELYSITSVQDIGSLINYCY